MCETSRECLGSVTATAQTALRLYGDGTATKS